LPSLSYLVLLLIYLQDFVRPLKGTSQRGSENALKKLQALLKAVLLRRTKKSEIDGKPILNLPERTNKSQNAVFNEDERTFYTALETKTAIQFNKYLKQGSVGRNYTNILVLLLRLRQACCHPHLIQDMEIQHNAEITVDEMTDLAKSLLPDVIARVKAMEGFECPICYDGVENPAIFIPCGHDTCTECFVKISNQSGQQNLARGNEVVSVKCPTCRGLIDPKKIIDYVTFKKVHMKEEGIIEVEEAIEENSETEDSDSDSDTDSDLADFVVPDSDGQDGADRNSSKNPGTNKKRDAKGKGKAKVKKTLAQLKKDAMKNAKSKARYMRRLEKNWESSAKVDKCCEILEDIQNKGTGEKTIVFSQFTSLLDLLEVPISRAGWKYERYDGSMSSTKRNDAVIEFTDNPECKIMLVSLKAGNAGLNLVAASQVVILDPFWNPYIEEQAIDRSHRIGQLRPVTVHRILVKETVEDRILQLQDKKRTLIEGALDEKASENIARLGNQELAFLFVSLLHLKASNPRSNY
jgi:SNF2 family DNA or RNA helicase